MSRALPSHIIDAVVRMKGEGKSNRDIGLSMGQPACYIAGICQRYRIKRPSGGRVDIPVGVRLKIKLQEQAELREVPLNRFLRELLKVIATDDLFAAILDDKR